MRAFEALVGFPEIRTEQIAVDLDDTVNGALALDDLLDERQIGNDTPFGSIVVAIA